ncbi:actin-related protein C1B [Actinidia rufa]|uniref:Arp2/3 complex 41 kDa subunit n=1 Tax=Actinidia rufa TaxID=165716 RepID=A0A7J0G4R1_9ERIC|nr:actin-related protein C1B [Actinidia rufa]
MNESLKNYLNMMPLEARDMIAFCPNNNEVHIHKLVEDKWERIHVLQKHDQIVSGIDWSMRSNRIVTVSHDRNSYVWNKEGTDWMPTLVILRLNRAALCVQWSPRENKFAVGSGAKTVCICYYEQDNNWKAPSTKVGVCMEHFQFINTSTWVQVSLCLNLVPVCVRPLYLCILPLFIYGCLNLHVQDGIACEGGMLDRLLYIGGRFPNNASFRNNRQSCRWVSKLIRKRHDSSVTSVAWHPNNILLATTSTDGKCRVFSTFIKGVDTRGSGTSSAGDTKFGEVDGAFPSCTGAELRSWYGRGLILPRPFVAQSHEVQGCGMTMVEDVGHNSMIYFVDEVGPAPSAQTIALRDLPLRDVLFVSERMVVGVGFDCNPMVFAADERGLWSFLRFLGERKISSSGAKYGSQFSEAFGKLYGQSKHGISNDIGEASRSRGGIHENCINCIVPVKKEGQSTNTRFSTSGLDGKVVTWDLENQGDLSEYL